MLFLPYFIFIFHPSLLPVIPPSFSSSASSSLSYSPLFSSSASYSSLLLILLIFPSFSSFSSLSPTTPPPHPTHPSYLSYSSPRYLNHPFLLLILLIPHPFSSFSSLPTLLSTHPSLLLILLIPTFYPTHSYFLSYSSLLLILYYPCNKYRDPTGVNIIPFSISFGIDKFETNGGKFFFNDNLKKNGANVLVEFEIFFLIGGFF